MRNRALFFIILLEVLLESSSVLAAPLCRDLLNRLSHQSSPVSQIDHLKSQDPAVLIQNSKDWNQLYKQSDMSPRPELWLRIRRSLEKHVTEFENPMESAETDPNKIGSVYKKLIVELPLLKTLMEFENRSKISHDEFIKLKRIAANKIISISYQPRSLLQVFAALEALNYLSSIESKVVFPTPKKNLEVETKKQEQETKKQEQVTDKEQENNEKQLTQEAEWNKVEDKYKPENKDLSQNGSSGKKKSVDIVLTDAEVPKGLMRQKIYDEFDLKSWTTNPVNRAQLKTEKNMSRKMIINPLGINEIEIPISYDYAPVVGKYAEYEIKEMGPGEFKLQVFQNKPVTIGLAKIISEEKKISFNNSVNPQVMSQWPKHLLTFAESLKGLSSVQAAEKLSKYISEEGGFLYYSQGDKISKSSLTILDKKYDQYINLMPKPMAMAHVGAFNCDGAAWIGALILRDVLGHQVRLAAGRTVSGIKNIENSKMHVINSSDPGHAWLEVFNGNRWVPYDMTPKNNVPEAQASSGEMNRENEEKNQSSKEEKSKDQKNKSEEHQKSDEVKNQSQSEQKNSEKNQDKTESKETENKNQPSQVDEQKSNSNQNKPIPDKSADENTEELEKKIKDLIQFKATQRGKDQDHSSLMDKILKENELTLLEQLISEGSKSSYIVDSSQFLNILNKNLLWTSAIERSKQKMNLIVQDSQYNQMTGLNNLPGEVKTYLNQNKTREALQKLKSAHRLIMNLLDYRSLTKSEIDALVSIQKITKVLESVKHKNSSSYEVVDKLMKDLPGNISKNWIKKMYGDDFNLVGSQANLKLAEDLVAGKLKPLLQVSAVSDFVDLMLNSTQEPRWDDEPTLNRSLRPQPREDLVVTRNPLDFAKMLWNLRPGENMFAPTLQGRQFAMGSLETSQIPNPKNPVEKKVSVVYYDVSGSMNSNGKIEVQDALLMAFVDKALSETDQIGRPIHEIFLIPFGDKSHEALPISSREDAVHFISKMMSFRTSAVEGNAYTRFIEEFYELVSASYKEKSNQGREKLFKKANMVLLTDGIYEVDLKSIEEAQKKLPPGLDIKLNFISLFDPPNQALVKAAQNTQGNGKKSTFHFISPSMIKSVLKISTAYDQNAFVANDKLNGIQISEIYKELSRIVVESKQSINFQKLDQIVSQIQTTKNSINSVSGLKEILSLQQLNSLLRETQMSPVAKQRILKSVIDCYPAVTGRDWNNMTYAEKEAFENLLKWSHE